MRILIADDHALFRDALARLVRSLVAEARVEEAGSLDEIRACLSADPDCELLLLDLRMPGCFDSDPVEALHRAHPAVPIVVISGSEQAGEAARARARGAVGFLRKSLAPAAMQQALQKLLAGEEIEAAPEPAGSLALPHLTPRQQEVLAAVAQGASNKQIAQQLGLSEGTVKLHVAAILLALDAGNRTEAAARARALGWA
ncbi:response regulator transcription factor [Piscinibacter sp. Jin2]|uniref:Response regulator transcription factor n=1 Tax=Aquariibacter lacus TaxID=2801332 RepID=A0A9X1BQJ3_9BURK|nr:response regulator transcription factor [Piscinibacter lacus]MBL0718608.1 response regulator transcription factor [Piscinibacter lacus]